MANIIYFLNEYLKEITFLINNAIIIDYEHIENMIYTKLNSYSKNCLIENGINYPCIFNVRVNKNRFDHQYYICIYVMEEYAKIDWDYVINIIGNIFNSKPIGQ